MIQLALVHLFLQVRIDTVVPPPTTTSKPVRASFQLLRRGCPVASANITAAPLAAPHFSDAAVFDSAGPLPEADGFAIALRLAGPGPVGIARAEILGSDDGGQTWHVAGRSDFRRVPNGIRPLGGPAGGPTQVRIGARRLSC